MASTPERSSVKIQSKITSFSKLFSSENEVTKKRRSLKTLQPSSKNTLTNRNTDNGAKKKGVKRSLDGIGEKSVKKRIRPQAGPVVVFREPETISSENSENNTTDTEADQLGLLTGPVTEAYWEEIAEKRRVALEESLVENEQLHAENIILKTENKDLKVENNKLTKLASHTEYLASILQELTGDDPIPGDDTESPQPVSCPENDKQSDNTEDNCSDTKNEKNEEICDKDQCENDKKENSEEIPECSTSCDINEGEEL